MGESNKLRNTSKDLNTILSHLVQNQNLKRYLYYLDNDPLSEDKTDIGGTLINENIILTPYDSRVVSEESVKIFVNLNSGNLRTQPVGIYTYSMEIICPLTKWVLEGKSQIRPHQIAYEITRKLDGVKINGVGKAEVENVNFGKLDETYGWGRLLFKVNTNTLKRRG